MKNTDWSVFTVQTPSGRPAAIAALSAFFYFDRPVHAIAKELADGIQRYAEYIGLDKLTMYTASSGYWKPWTTRVLNKDLKHLRNFPADHEAFHVDYDSADVPGPFGLALQATVLTAAFEKRRANLMRLDFPVQWLETHTAETFIDFVGELLACMSPQSANVGLAFKRTEGSKSDATKGVHRLLPRYIGFDPCYSDVRDLMLGRVFSAHWLNFADDKLLGSLGGADAVAAALPGCETRHTGKGLLIRGAKLPPVGDMNRGATDLGCLPDVARVFKPLRPDIQAFGDPLFDAQRWLARFDELPVRPWDNNHAA